MAISNNQNFFSQWDDEHMLAVVFPLMQAKGIPHEKLEFVRDYNVADSEAPFMHMSVDKSAITKMFNVASKAYDQIKNVFNRGKQTPSEVVEQKFLPFVKEYFICAKNHIEFDTKAFISVFTNAWDQHFSRTEKNVENDERRLADINSGLVNAGSLALTPLAGNNPKSRYFCSVDAHVAGLEA